MRVVYFQRAKKTGFSIERLFDEVRAALPPAVQPRVWHAPYAGARPDLILRNLAAANGLDGDVNHVTGDTYYLALALKKARTVLSIMDCVALKYLTSWKRFVARKLWFEWPIRHAFIVAVISQSTADELCQSIAIRDKTLRVIHCPLSSAFRAFLGRPFAALPTLLQVGTVRTKNIERLAEALAGVPCRLRIIGQPCQTQTEALHKFNIQYDVLTGISDDQLQQEYAGSDVVVFASTYEGFGLPIIEAQAVGRPVVTSNVCSMPEVAGDAACLVDPFDAQSIRNGILKVINDRSYRESLVARGFENVKRFEVTRIAKQYYDLYCEIMAGQK